MQQEIPIQDNDNVMEKMKITKDLYVQIVVKKYKNHIGSHSIMDF